MYDNCPSKHPLEVESKYRLIGNQAELLEEQLGTPCEEAEQEDRYFDVEPNSLRIRREGGRYFLTQKGAPVLSENGVKSRSELERAITAGEASLLSELLPWCGHRERTTVRKRRKTFRWENVLLCLDRIEGLPDGYLEIESTEGKIESVKRAIAWLENRIGLASDQLERSSYAKLVGAARSQEEDEAK